MNDVDRLLTAMRGPEPPAEPPQLPEEEEEQGGGPGFLPLLIAAMVLLGIGVVTLAPDDEDIPVPGGGAMEAAEPAPEAPAEAEEQAAEEAAGSGAAAPRATSRKSASGGSSGAATSAARDPLRCLEQLGVERADVAFTYSFGDMVTELELIDPRNPELEGCLRRALLGTRRDARLEREVFELPL